MALINSYSPILTAICIWREARGESPEVRSAVLWVLNNRVANPAFRPSVMRVILQPAQFSSMTNLNDAETIKWPVDAPSTVADWKAFAECCALVESGISGDDPTRGAVYYESYPVSKLEQIRIEMPWFSAANLTAQIGALRFYRS